VLTDSLTQADVLATVKQGRNFVSDGPLLAIQSGEALMGSTVSAGSEVTVHAADVRGLLLLRIIADGEEVLRRDLLGETSVTLTIPTDARRFVRAEIISNDGRRAFSNPLYIA